MSGPSKVAWVGIELAYFHRDTHVCTALYAHTNTHRYEKADVVEKSRQTRHGNQHFSQAFKSTGGESIHIIIYQSLAKAEV